MAMRRVVNAEWKPTVPALVNLVAASGAPHLRAAFAAAGLDGIRPAQAVALIPLAAGGLHASDLADQFRVSRQAVAQGIAALERHGYVTRVPDPDDARALLLDPPPVTGGAQLGQGRPLLAVPSHVLAFIQADRAVGSLRAVLDAAGAADRQIGVHAPSYTRVEQALVTRVTHGTPVSL